MRILYLLDHWPTESETFISNELAALEASGVEIEVLTCRDSRLARSLQSIPLSAACVAHAVMMLRRPKRYLRYISALLRLGRACVPWFIFAPYVAHLINDRQPAAVYTHFLNKASALSALASVMTDSPAFAVAHAGDIFVRPCALPAKARSLHILTISSYNDNYLRRLGISVRGIVHCGVDMERFDRFKRTPKPGLILSVGRLVQKKGHDDLIRSFALMAESSALKLELRIIGEGEDRPALEGLIRSLHLVDQVKLLGSMGQAQVLDQLKEASVFALFCKKAATGDLDGIPVALMEAMACGVPVVTTSVSGIPELVDRTCGGIFMSGDTLEGSRLLTRAVRGGDLVDAESERAHQRVSAEFSLQHQVQRMVEIVRRD